MTDDTPAYYRALGLDPWDMIGALYAAPPEWLWALPYSHQVQVTAMHAELLAHAVRWAHRGHTDEARLDDVRKVIQIAHRLIAVCEAAAAPKPCAPPRLTLDLDAAVALAADRAEQGPVGIPDTLDGATQA